MDQEVELEAEKKEGCLAGLARQSA